ncbi:unnamed protein product [Arctogadus glacialis]
MVLGQTGNSHFNGGGSGRPDGAPHTLTRGGEHSAAGERREKNTRTDGKHAVRRKRRVRDSSTRSRDSNHGPIGAQWAETLVLASERNAALLGRWSRRPHWVWRAGPADTLRAPDLTAPRPGLASAAASSHRPSSSPAVRSGCRPPELVVEGDERVYGRFPVSPVGLLGAQSSDPFLWTLDQNPRPPPLWTPDPLHCGPPPLWTPDPLPSGPQTPSTGPQTRTPDPLPSGPQTPSPLDPRPLPLDPRPEPPTPSPLDPRPLPLDPRPLPLDPRPPPLWTPDPFHWTLDPRPLPLDPRPPPLWTPDPFHWTLDQNPRPREWDQDSWRSRAGGPVIGPLSEEEEPLVLAVGPETPLQHYTPPSSSACPTLTSSAPEPRPPRPGGRTLRPPQHLPLRPAAPSQKRG